MQSIALIDYGSGNLRSAEKALLKASSGMDGARDIVVTADPEVIAAADAVVLPGVGAFAACMGLVEARPGLTEALDEAVRGRGVPFLGICVGMQLLASRGLEFGETRGLGRFAQDLGELRLAGRGEIIMAARILERDEASRREEAPIEIGADGGDDPDAPRGAERMQQGRELAALIIRQARCEDVLELVDEHAPFRDLVEETRRPLGVPPAKGLLGQPEQANAFILSER